MAKVHTESEKTSVEKLSAFLQNNKKLLLIIFAAIVVVVGAIGIIVAVSQSSFTKRLEEVELLQEEFAALANNTEDLEEAELSSRFETLTDDLDQLIKKAGTGYPELRALYLKASILYSQENYAEAAESFLAVAETYPDSHLAPSAYMNSGASFEQAGDQDAAVNAYRMVVSEFGSNTSVTPHAMFSIARVLDTSGNSAAAVTQYRELADSYPSSEWGKLALSRLLALE